MTLRSYFIKSYLKNTAYMFIIFIAIIILGNLFNLADVVINKAANIFTVLKLIMLSLPVATIYSLPLASTVAITMTQGYMKENRELLVVDTSGIKRSLFYIPCFIVAIVMSLILASFSLTVTPYSNSIFKKEYRNMIEREFSLESLFVPRKITDFKTANSKITFYFEGYESRHMKNFIATEFIDSRINILKANHARVVKASTGFILKAINGTLTSFDFDKKKEVFTSKFKEAGFTITIPGIYTEKTPDEMNIFELIKKGDFSSMLEMNLKLAITLSTIPLFIFGIKLSKFVKRTSAAFSIGTGIAVAFAYNLILTVCMNGTLNYGITPLVLHIPNSIFLLAGLIL